MSRSFLLSATAVILTLCFVQPSLESKQVCTRWYGDPKCRARNEVCCNGVCNSTCVGKQCRWNSQCSSSSKGHKCCAGHCRASCEGRTCDRNADCKDRSLKCCNKLCRKGSCLGATCHNGLPAYRSCGSHRRSRLDCCSGKCQLSCQNKPCNDNNDCGGHGRRMKCCNGICKRSCVGSLCIEHNDCQSSKLDCCGFFDNKTCARSCRNHDCSLNERYECGRQRNSKLFCCGDGKCHASCAGSICFTETFRYDCKAPGRLLYCCGMGQKICRSSCIQVVCKKNEDCGMSKYYCGRPDRRNVTRCSVTHHSDLIHLYDVNLEDYT